MRGGLSHALKASNSPPRRKVRSSFTESTPFRWCRSAWSMIARAIRCAAPLADLSAPRRRSRLERSSAARPSAPSPRTAAAPAAAGAGSAPMVIFVPASASPRPKGVQILLITLKPLVFLRIAHPECETEPIRDIEMLMHESRIGLVVEMVRAINLDQAFREYRRIQQTARFGEIIEADRPLQTAVEIVMV